MNTTFSFLYTVLDRLRTYLDDASVDAKYTNDFLVRHIVMPSMTDVLSRINNTSCSKIVHKWDWTLRAGVERYKLPPTVMEVIRIVLVDTDGTPIIDAYPEDIMHRNGPGWMLEGDAGAMELWVDTATQGLYAAQLWYVSSGDVLCHYATDGTVTNLGGTTGTWSESGLTLTQVGAFADYTWQYGDKVSVYGGTGVTVGDYVVSSRTSDDAIVLATSIGASASSVDFRLHTRDLVLSSSPTLGGVDRRENGYSGQILRLLPATGRVQERIIEASYVDLDDGDWHVTTRIPFDPTGTGGIGDVVVTYEIAPAGSQALCECIAARAAMKLGAHRKVSEAHMKMLRVEYLSALKSVGDRLTFLNSRKPKHIEKHTIDNKDDRGWGYMWY